MNLSEASIESLAKFCWIAVLPSSVIIHQYLLMSPAKNSNESIVLRVNNLI